MFTGIIKDIGTIEALKKIPEGLELRIKTKLAPQIKIDDSVCTNGVCLTAIKVGVNFFTAQIVKASLSKTTFNKAKIKDKVNLELSLKIGDGLDGHFVSGHVQGKAKILKILKNNKNILVTLKIQNDIEPYCVKEGSITINGVSLTIFDINSNEITLSIIPHTYENTIFKYCKIGQEVNVEVDMFAKYIEKLIIKYLPAK